MLENTKNKGSLHLFVPLLKFVFLDTAEQFTHITRGGGI